MRKKTSILLFSVVLAVLTLGQAQCPQQWPKPPFDTTGLFKGTWSGQATAEETQQVLNCPLTLHLEQNVSAPYPGDHVVNGWVEIDYSCLELPDWMQETPAPSHANISGLVADDGKLSLFSGGCGTGLCLVLIMAGEGSITDADGTMDVYNGVWSFYVLLAGVQPFGVSGTFQLTRWLE